MEKHSKSTHLLNHQLKHNLRRRPQIIQLQILRLVEPILWRQRAKQAVWAAVQSHGPVWMFCDERGGGKGFALEVRKAIAKHVVQARGLLALPRCRVRARVFGLFGEEV